ncbi:hypothetical protein D3C86_1696300 [compost metagenome]
MVSTVGHVVAGYLPATKTSDCVQSLGEREEDPFLALLDTTAAYEVSEALTHHHGRCAGVAGDELGHC